MQDAVKKGASAAQVATITKDLAKSTPLKMIKFAGRALGVTSMFDHGRKFIGAVIDGNVESATINGAKLIVDTAFFVSKSTNPVVLGASVAYGVADYITNDY